MKSSRGWEKWVDPWEAADIPSQINRSRRNKLDRYIAKYNQQFKTNYNSGDQFYAYYRDIADRVKKKQIDICQVINMFMIGFDSKLLNTLYVDKNLKYHGLIQAFIEEDMLKMINGQSVQSACAAFWDV